MGWQGNDLAKRPLWSSLCYGEVEIESAFAQRLGMGFRGGGEGFFLQRLRGRAPSGSTEVVTFSISISLPGSG
jgi:hypothetical protein